MYHAFLCGLVLVDSTPIMCVGGFWLSRQRILAVNKFVFASYSSSACRKPSTHPHSVEADNMANHPHLCSAIVDWQIARDYAAGAIPPSVGSYEKSERRLTLCRCLEDLPGPTTSFYLESSATASQASESRSSLKRRKLSHHSDPVTPPHHTVPAHIRGGA